MGLDFDILRRANKERLKTFRNNTGALAHSTEDGSDWSHSDWFAAMAGEFGEFQEVLLNMALGKSVGMMGENIKKFVRGDYDQEAFLSKFSNEAADIVIYLDIMCRLAGIEPHQTFAPGDPARAHRGCDPLVVDPRARALDRALALLQHVEIEAGADQRAAGGAVPVRGAEPGEEEEVHRAAVLLCGPPRWMPAKAESESDRCEHERDEGEFPLSQQRGHRAAHQRGGQLPLRGGGVGEVGERGQLGQAAIAAHLKFHAESYGYACGHKQNSQCCQTVKAHGVTRSE